MEEINTISIAIILVGILNLILFILICVITNDINAIRNKIKPKYTSYHFEVRKLIALGNKDEAKKVILNAFFYELQNYTYAEEWHKFKLELEEELSQIGEEMPAKLKEINSFKEYKELFE
jgi:hypothetical protein